MKKEIKLYNVLFPIWFLLIFPITWIIVLPANFIIDSIVLLITIKLLKRADIKENYKKTILKVWMFGFLSDFIGAGILFLTQMPNGDWWYEYISSPVSYNPFDNLYSLSCVFIAIIASGIAIYLFNVKISFKTLNYDLKTKKVIALSLAIFTAPYILLMPSELMYDSNGSSREIQVFTNHIVSTKRYDVTVEYEESDAKVIKRKFPQDTNYNHVIINAVNTAKQVYKGQVIDIRKPDFKIIFQNIYDEKDKGVKIDLWLEENTDEYLFKINNKWYNVNENKSKTIKEGLTKLKNSEFIKKFKIIEYTGSAPETLEKIYKDDKNIYYLSSTRARKIILEFEDGVKLDLQKALEINMVTIEELIEEGLKVIVEKI
jgi:hypothetical protein